MRKSDRDRFLNFKEQVDEVILDTKWHEIKQDNSKFVAEGLSNNQALWWARVANVIDNREDISSIISDVMSAHGGSIAIAEEASDFYAVRSALPVIIGDVERFRFSSRASSNLFADIIAAKLITTNVNIDVGKNLNLSAGVIFALIVYLGVDVSDDIQLEKAAVSGNVSKMQSEIEQLHDSYRQSILSIKEDSARIIKDLQSSAESEIDALRNAQKELTRISPAVELWKTKTFDHLLSVIVGSVIFISTIAISVYLIFRYGDEYVRNMPLDSVHAQVTTSVLLIAPLLGVAWILKLVSKYISQNLIFMEDAKHRRAITASYLGLLSSEGVPAISESERAIALQALFRPSPGAAPDLDLAPPSIIDLVRGKTD